jgi:hypothetical protein
LKVPPGSEAVVAKEIAESWPLLARSLSEEPSASPVSAATSNS